MSVRALIASDAGGLCARVASVLPGTWSAEAIDAELERDDARIWGAFDGEHLRGFVMLRLALDEAELLLIGVDPAARRRGVARALWQAALPPLIEAGVQAVFLEVRASNAAARALYAALDFEAVGTRRRYYSDPDEDAVVLRRTLSAGAPTPEPPPQKR